MQDLAWLVGEWIDDKSRCGRRGYRILDEEQRLPELCVQNVGAWMDDLEGTQVIGWDPAAGTIRSWMFDSDGGFGEGTWSKEHNRWIVKFSQVLPDGRKATATNVYTLVDNDTFTWKSIGRTLDGQLLPNVEEVKMVRKTASGALSRSRQERRRIASARDENVK